MGRHSEAGNVVGRSRLRFVGTSVLAAGLAFAGPARLAGADEAFQCGLGDSEEIAESDARTSAGLVCDQLRRASGGLGVYEVRFAALGKAVFVTATRRDPADSVTVRVDAVEEMEIAAERIAQALVRGKPFASTQRVGNLLESETHPALTKKGSLKFLVGVVDVESPGHGARVAGFSIGILYAAPTFALPAEMRFAWDDASELDPKLGLFSISLGGRLYLSRKDVSPFLGGGFGVLNLNAREGVYPAYGAPSSDSRFFHGERFGVAPYLEVGAEALRLHRARLALHVRADIPMSALESPAVPIYASYEGDWQRGPVVESVYPAQSRYIVPVSIGLSVAF